MSTGEGVEFRVHPWQNWHFRLVFKGRDGLGLYSLVRILIRPSTQLRSKVMFSQVFVRGGEKGGE